MQGSNIWQTPTFGFSLVDDVVQCRAKRVGIEFMLLTALPSAMRGFFSEASCPSCNKKRLKRLIELVQNKTLQTGEPYTGRIIFHLYM
jgi:hypothetical protein